MDINKLGGMDLPNNSRPSCFLKELSLNFLSSMDINKSGVIDTNTHVLEGVRALLLFTSVSTQFWEKVIFGKLY